jgi:hypothetical protein
MISVFTPVNFVREFACSLLEHRASHSVGTKIWGVVNPTLCISSGTASKARLYHFRVAKSALSPSMHLAPFLVTACFRLGLRLGLILRLNKRDRLYVPHLRIFFRV